MPTPATRARRQLEAHQSCPQRGGHPPGTRQPWASPGSTPSPSTAGQRHVRRRQRGARRRRRAARTLVRPASRCRAGVAPPDWWCWTLRRATAAGRRDPASPVPGLTPIQRMPVAVRGGLGAQPATTASSTRTRRNASTPSRRWWARRRVERPRTRAGLTEIPETGCRAARSRAGGGAAAAVPEPQFSWPARCWPTCWPPAPPAPTAAESLRAAGATAARPWPAGTGARRGSTRAARISSASSGVPHAPSRACTACLSTLPSRWPPVGLKMDDATVPARCGRRWPVRWPRCARRICARRAAGQRAAAAVHR